MCSAARSLILIGLASSLATPARSQETALYARRVDSLAKVYERAQLRLKTFNDSVMRNTRRYDTVIVPPVRVLTDSISMRLATDAARYAATVLRRTFGAALDEVATHSFVVRIERTNKNPYVFVGGLDADGREYNIAMTRPRSDDVSGALTGTVRRLLDVQVDPKLRHWLGEAVPVDTAGPAVWTNVRLALLSGPTTAGKRCYAGNIASCTVILGLASVDDPAAVLLDSADRHRMVSTIATQTWRELPAETAPCTSGNDASCVEVLRKMPMEMLHAMLGSPHRASVVQTALAIGGSGATERLLLTPGNPSQRLAAAAGVSTDSVVRVWRQRVHDARVATDAMTPGVAASSLVWILAFGALALRSSRWR
jgi:hypothetical protein